MQNTPEESGSAICASCPKSHRCFWCNTTVCWGCTCYMEVTMNEIKEAIFSSGPANTMVCPHRPEPLQENLLPILVCRDCFNKSPGGPADATGKSPNP